MGKIRKGFLAKLVGSDKNCCCRGPYIVSVRNIKIDGNDTEIIGLDEEFEKLRVANKAPENVNVEELIQNIAKTNVIPDNKFETFKVILLEEYAKCWNEKKLKSYR